MGKKKIKTAEFAPVQVAPPYLVQRVQLREAPSEFHKGIDRWFAMDYMGSAEFEFGALSKALKRIRANKERYLAEPQRIKLESGEVAWYVGTEDYLEIVKEFFRDQLGPRDSRLKERTSIQEAYSSSKPNLYMIPDQMGWWAIDAEFPWLLFKKKDAAKKWLNTL